MLQDFRFGLKLLWKQKAFSFAALLTLALCIGANTAIFTVLNAVVLQGLPFPDAERLVTMYNVYPGVGVTDRGANGTPDYVDRRKMTDVFTEVTLMGNNGYDVDLAGTPQRVDGGYVTPSYFRVFNVRPIIGRAFTEEEGTIGHEKVAILSEGLWKDLYARNPNVTSRDIRLSGELYRIVGVMPDYFGRVGGDVRVWVPFALTQRQMSDDARHSNNWGMAALLKPGITIRYAQQRIDAINKANIDRMPKYRDLLISARFGTKVLGLKDELVRDIRPVLYLLQVAVGVVLLIGCVNLANLMLVRSSVRMKELAVRFSLGASRWRLGRQLLTESIALAVVGGALGVAVGFAGVRLLSYLGAKDLPRGESIHIDAGVLAFTAAVAIVTGIIFGSVPLIHLFRRDLNQVFRENDRSGTHGKRALWLRSTLVVSQVALAFVLLMGSALLAMSFSRLLTVNPGFHSENVVTARLSLPRSRYKDDPAARSFLSGVLTELRSVPGLRSVGATTYLPFSGNNNSSVLMFENHPLARGENPPVPGWNHIDSGYLPAMSIPLLQGRNFNESDGPDAQKVAIIDQFLAKKYFPNGDAVGKRLRRGIGRGNEEQPMCTIVGVVGSVKTGDLAEQNPVGQVYFAYQQFVPRDVHIVVKADRADPQLTSVIRRIVTKADAGLPIFDTKTMPQRLSSSLENRRAAMVLCLVFAALALLLSSVGIYGVLAYSVTQRTREFGIRVALGASWKDVVSMVMGQGLKVAGVGLVIGAAGAFAVMRLMTTMLYDVKPTDPGVFLVVAVVLGSIALLASLIPSMRALRIRPATALRHE
jgi:predicted permease